MSKRRADRYETGHGFGPLFTPPAEHLSGRTDPQTSRDAAGMVAGRLTDEQRLAASIVRDSPGCTAPEMGQELANHDPESRSSEYWRQRIGRRLNELEKAGLVRRDGVRDGCSIWWPADSQVCMTAPVPCRTCGAPVLWVKTEKGARMPLDPVPVEAGRIIIVMGPQMGRETAHSETKEEIAQRLKCKDPAARTAFMPHHATCPQGRQWQRGRK